MSLIYEALEKVEQEKKEFSPPPKEKIQRLGSQPKERTWAFRGIALVFTLCLGAGLFYLLASFLWTHPFKETPKKLPVSSSVVRLSPVPRTPVSLPVPKKKKQFALTGMTRMGDDWTAIVNNQLVRVGDWVSGAKLVRIEQGEVTLDDDGQTVSLRM